MLSYLLAHTSETGDLDNHQEMHQNMVSSTKDSSNYKSHLGWNKNSATNYSGGHFFFMALTWLAIMALLISIARYFWIKAVK